MTSKLSPLASGVLALCVGVFCAGAHAQAKSRDEVRQELAQAVRDGTLMHGEAGPRDAQPMTQPRTRADVRAEFDAARRDGELLAAGEAGPTPQAHDATRAPQATLAGKTRAQVRAELAEAQRNGELLAAGEAAFTPRAPSAAPARVQSVVAGTPGAAPQAVH